MSPLTPIKIRGKRGASEAEKWHSFKKRKVARNHDPECSTRDGTPASTVSTASCSKPSRERKAPPRELSKLEQLPTEILQDIFEYSGNLNLPFASLELKLQLCSKHMYLRLTTRTMRAVLGFARGTDRARAKDSDLAAASRLLNCRFMTFAFFRDWVEAEWCLTFTPTEDDRVRHDSRQCSTVPRLQAMLAQLRPSGALLPPKRAITGPWTSDNLGYLESIVTTCYIGKESPRYTEYGMTGLRRAVQDASPDALKGLFSMGLEPDPELIRFAVCSCACDLDVVRTILNENLLVVIRRPTDSPNAMEPVIDPLEPTLWAWAEHDRAAGGAKGKKLTGMLKAHVRELSQLQLDRSRGPIDPRVFATSRNRPRSPSQGTIII
ncbi:hypothetical protein BAUCODRAFT_547651 [Baudoinia panamericana UAMH 10762]|uniref:F-box domain-containing protein n=1 Tax=Baudoinia panamericana (strain UAMH 10762) TaxID=717646 RepID=M2MSD2_BAUPA|nr:uncharacterized protein BAUCODRAFT_547651 [Baudoinia panamericana UAMH 10762]EMC94413.1 hypothetical protein BAUCODRAFT_547651 [Baudoinia panamericana UAMH 10762]